MATWTFVKATGAPPGTITIDVGNNRFIIDDVSNTTITTTDQSVADDLETVRALTLQGVSGTDLAPPVVQDVVLVNGVLSTPAGNGTWTPVSAVLDALSPTSVKTTAYTAGPGELVSVDASGGSVPIALPTAPAAGTRVCVSVVTQAATPNNVTISAGSAVFSKAGGSSTLVLSNLSGVLLQYNSGIWYVTALNSPLPTSVANMASAAAYPETFGAVGDGITDDTAALLLWQVSGTRLALMPGRTYLHRRPLAVTGTLEGNGATLKRAPQSVTTTTDTITAGVTKTITVADASVFQVNDQIVVESGGYFDQTPQTIKTIVGNQITTNAAFGSNTGQFWNNANGIPALSGITNVRHGWIQLSPGPRTLINNLVLDGNSANWQWGRWQCNAAINTFYTEDFVRVVGCRIVNQYGDGCELAGPYTTVRDCHFENIAGRGVVFAGGNEPLNFGTRIVDSQFINCNWDIAVGGSDGPAAIAFSKGGPNTLISGNYIDGSYDGIGYASVENSSGLTCTDNEIWNVQRYPMFLTGGVQDCRDLIVTDNRIYGGVSTTINMTGTATHPRRRYIFARNILVGVPLLVWGCAKVAVKDNIIDIAALPAPEIFYGTASTGGGTFTPGTYYAQVSAYNSHGETVGSVEASATVVGNGKITWSWSLVPGAAGYHVYRSSVSGGESSSPALIATTVGSTVCHYVDTGAAPGSGSVPASDSSAYVSTPTLTLGGSFTTIDTIVQSNIIRGGSQGIVANAGCVADIQSNLLSGQAAAAILDNAAGNTLTIRNNTVIGDSTASDGWAGIKLLANGDRVTGNRIDATGLPASGIGITVGAACSGTLLRGNDIASNRTTVTCIGNAGTTTTIVANVASALAGTPVIADSGTATIRFDNTLNGTLLDLIIPPSADLLTGPAMAVAPKILLPLSADLNDISGNGYKATAFTGGGASATDTYGAGRYGLTKALKFTGGLYLKTPYTPFTTGGVQRTLFGLAYRTDSSNHNGVFSGSVATGNHFPRLYCRTASQDVIYHADLANDPTGVTWANAWPGNARWVAWALVINTAAQTVELYINGVSKGSQSDTHDFTAGNALWVGTSAGSIPWAGAMALFGVAEAALSAAQIGTLHGYITGSKNSNPALSALIAQAVAEGVVMTDATSS